MLSVRYGSLYSCKLPVWVTRPKDEQGVAHSILFGSFPLQRLMSRFLTPVLSIPAPSALPFWFLQFVFFKLPLRRCRIYCTLFHNSFFPKSCREPAREFVGLVPRPPDPP